VACSAEDLGEASEMSGYSNHSNDSINSPPIPVVWGDSVVLVDLWLQGVVTWSFAPLPWAMYGHGLARRHLRPCRGSRPRYIFNLQLKTRETLQGRRETPPHEVSDRLALGIWLYFIRILSCLSSKIAVSRAQVYPVHLHLSRLKLQLRS